MTITVIICGLMFGVGTVCAAIRLIRGPGVLDRAAALDVLLATVVGVIVLNAAATGSSTTLIVAVVVAFLGFLGTASLAKLLPREKQ